MSNRVKEIETLITKDKNNSDSIEDILEDFPDDFDESEGILDKCISESNLEILNTKVFQKRTLIKKT